MDRQQDRVQNPEAVIKAAFSSWNQATENLAINVQFIHQKMYVYTKY